MDFPLGENRFALIRLIRPPERLFPTGRLHFPDLQTAFCRRLHTEMTNTANLIMLAVLLDLPDTPTVLVTA
ncbi:hypothetical protein [Neisseria animalis]|uniref:hypothetical protein n=1 Tax=Neisseria animalis TaxID=492 RepID=UPI000F845CFE|nr:hypothetical protein [Neisseria animalis]